MRKTSQKFSQSHMLCKVALVAIMLAFQAMLGIGAGVLNAQTLRVLSSLAVTMNH